MKRKNIAVHNMEYAIFLYKKGRTLNSAYVFTMLNIILNK